MAEIVMGFGSSHSPLLNSPAEDYTKHAEIDKSTRKLLDRTGRQVSYEELLAQADPSIADQITLEIMQEREQACTHNIEHLGREIAKAELDALIIVGDDQREQYHEDNTPAILIYCGKSIVNNPLNMPEDAPEFWRHARSQYHVPATPQEYPVASQLAEHLVDFLMDDCFDISYSRQLANPHGEGHAFGYVHRRLMSEKIVPIVPVALNTYFPPNQPRPRRCYELGQGIARAVRDFDETMRVGVLASGGLSHFAVDAEFDNMVLDACRNKDAETLCSIDPERLKSGTSEVRNWITVAGACEHLDTAWQEYVPCYRSPAGTGCGMAFAVWQ